MQINIGWIKIDSISGIGSFNVGKTILCKNQSSEVSYSTQSKVNEETVLQESGNSGAATGTATAAAE